MSVCMIKDVVHYQSFALEVQSPNVLILETETQEISFYHVRKMNTLVERVNCMITPLIT